MAPSDAQDRLYRLFAEIAGAFFVPGRGLEGVFADGGDVNESIPVEGAGETAGTPLREGPGGGASWESAAWFGSAGGGLAGSIIEAAVANSTSAQAAAHGQGGGGSTAAKVLKSGFGLVPLVGALFGLFGGGDDPAPPPLVRYALPARRWFEAAETASGVMSVDYDQAGRPRAFDGAGAGIAPQINVHVQAMDARSFLDRSSEIAAAVRDAMLNLNAINDVVNEL